jgi:hypothetical protein
MKVGQERFQVSPTFGSFRWHSKRGTTSAQLLQCEGRAAYNVTVDGDVNAVCTNPERARA